MKWLQEIAEEEGVAPEALRRRPFLPVELALAWGAFWDLYGDRQFGMIGMGPIQWTAIDRYAERHGISGADEFDLFRYRIQVLDDAYREAMKPEED